MRPPCPTRHPRVAAARVVLTVLLAGGSCTPTALLNLVSTRRGNVTIGFVNNTPFRANFTFGTYDPLDKDTVPVFSQLRIEGNSVAPQQTQGCRREFSIGGAELTRLITLRKLDITDEPVFHDDVFFSSTPANDPGAALPTEGTAAQLVLRDGIDYTCGGLLLFVFTQDATAPGGFRITYTFLNP